MARGQGKISTNEGDFFFNPFVRPELSEVVASFDDVPVEFQLLVNIDITELTSLN